MKRKSESQIIRFSQFVIVFKKKKINLIVNVTTNFTQKKSRLYANSLGV